MSTNRSFWKRLVYTLNFTSQHGILSIEIFFCVLNVKVSYKSFNVHNVNTVFCNKLIFFLKLWIKFYSTPFHLATYIKISLWLTPAVGLNPAWLITVGLTCFLTYRKMKESVSKFGNYYRVVSFSKMLPMLKELSLKV